MFTSIDAVIVVDKGELEMVLLNDIESHKICGGDGPVSLPTSETPITSNGIVSGPGGGTPPPGD